MGRARDIRDGEMGDLAAQECIPCKGGVPPLGAVEIDGLLARLKGGWQVKDGHHLSKTYPFKNFTDGLAFVNRVGELAEQQGHHPDVLLRWGQVRVDIFTHKVDGLTESDFVLAAKIDALPRG